MPVVEHVCANSAPSRTLPRPAVSERGRLVVICAIATVFLYFGLFKWPLIPIWVWGDQSIFLLHAERMLHGEVLYRDLFQFNMPGTECLYYILFRCFGDGLLIAPMATWIVGVITTGLVYCLSRRVLKGVAAMVPPIMYLVLPLGNRLDATHHTFSMPLVLLAVNLVAERVSVLRITAASALLGVAGVFTSSRGIVVLAAIALYLVLVEFREAREFVKLMTSLLLPFAVITTGVLGSLVYRVGARVIYESIVVFTLKYYGADRMNNGVWAMWYEIRGAFPLEIHSMPLVTMLACASVPVILVAFMACPMRRTWAHLRSSSDRTLVLYAFVGSALVLSVANSANSLRLTCAFPFGMILAFWMLSGKIGELRIRQFAVLVLLFGMLTVTFKQVRKLNRVDTPRGPVIMYRVPAESYAWIIRRSRPGDSFFGDPDINYIACLRNPSTIPAISNNGYTRPEQIASLIDALERDHTRFIEPTDDLTADVPGSSIKPFAEYLHRHYRLAATSEDGTEIFERLPEGSAASSSGIALNGAAASGFQVAQNQ
jgi:hypothetical protein